MLKYMGLPPNRAKAFKEGDGVCAINGARCIDTNALFDGTTYAKVVKAFPEVVLIEDSTHGACRLAPADLKPWPSDKGA